MSVVACAPVVAKLPASAKVPVVVVRLRPSEATTTARDAAPALKVGRRLKPAAIKANSERIAADAAKAPVPGAPDGV